MEELVVKEREYNAIMTMASGRAKRKNLMEGIIKMITIINLEMVTKRGEISGCDTASAINVDGIITTPMGFILSGKVIPELSVLQLITTIGSCQEPPLIMVLLADLLEEEVLKELTWLLNRRHIYMS